MFDHDDCRAYIDHVRLHFRHLQQMVDQLKTKLSEARDSATAGDDACQLVADIGDRFGAYVAEEKGGGCIDEAVCRCPRLAPHEREISLQYASIQELIERLSQLLAGCDLSGTSGRTACEEADRLATAFSRLESSERYLLREAFGSDESYSSRR